MPRTLEEAKTITDKGIEFGVHQWDGGTPVTDELIMERAEEIVGLVVELSKNGSVNDALLELLHIAKIEPQSDATREAYVQKFGEQPEMAPSNGHSADAVAPDGTALGQSGGAFAGSPEPVKEAAPSGGEDSIEDAFPGYDDRKVADIKKAILFSCADGSMTPEEWERIKAYEAAHEERRTILSLEPEFKAPEPYVPEQQLGVADIKQEQRPESTTQTLTINDQGAMAGTFTLTLNGKTTGPIPWNATLEEQQQAVHAAGIDVTLAARLPVKTSVYNTADDQQRLDNPPESSSEAASVEDLYDGKVQTRAQQENLAIPGTPDGQPPMLPIDITTIGDAELSQIATEFHNHFARAQWLLSQEDARERMSEHLEREAERDAFVAAYALHKENIPEEKRSQPTALEAARKQAEHDAELAAPVRKWRSKKIIHAVDARELKALAAIYDKAVWRINEELDRRARLVTTRPAS